MKILHVIPAVGPYYGGPSVAIRGMAEGAARAGAEVEVVTTDANGPRSLDVPIGSPSRESGVTYRYFRRTLPGEWKFSLPLTRWLFEHLAQYDLVHVHALFSYTTIPGCRFAANAKVPYLLRPLGTLAHWSLGLHAWKKWPYYRLVERHHLRHAAAIHATSEAEAVEIRALGVAATVRVVPLGVTIDAEAPEPRARRQDGSVHLLFLSRIDPKKGLPLIFQAMAVAGNGLAGSLLLTVAGDGPKEYRAALSRMVHELGLTSRVNFVGFVSGAPKRELFRASDIFVLPSHDENFGIAVVEALAAGLPVIVSEQVAVAPEVAAAGAGLVVPLDAAALAAAITALALDPASRNVAAANAWALARKRYSWNRSSDELVRLYRELISVSGGPLSLRRRGAASVDSAPDRPGE